jgi:hypothetical protein
MAQGLSRTSDIQLARQVSTLEPEGSSRRSQKPDIAPCPETSVQFKH